MIKRHGHVWSSSIFQQNSAVHAHCVIDGTKENLGKIETCLQASFGCGVVKVVSVLDPRPGKGRRAKVTRQ